MTGCESDSHEGKVQTPAASSYQESRHYEEVIADFEEQGFTNIRLEVIDDLVLGWLTKDGDVESVSIDGDVEYRPNVWYPSDTEVVITYHTFPADDAEKDDRPEETIELETEEDVASKNDILQESVFEEENDIPQESSPEEIVHTIDNCEDLATVLSLTGDYLPEWIDFAEEYKGEIIEFDGCILHLMHPDKWKSRYDILMSAWDYVDENTAQPGPLFKFEDVNAHNLGLESIYLPFFVEIGTNIRIKAKVLKFNDITGIIMLDPILITER